jgi:hypothetical protein
MKSLFKALKTKKVIIPLVATLVTTLVVVGLGVATKTQLAVEDETED